MGIGPVVNVRAPLRASRYGMSRCRFKRDEEATDPRPCQYRLSWERCALDQHWPGSLRGAATTFRCPNTKADEFATSRLRSARAVHEQIQVMMRRPLSTLVQPHWYKRGRSCGVRNAIHFGNMSGSAASDVNMQRWL